MESGDVDMIEAVIVRVLLAVGDAESGSVSFIPPDGLRADAKAFATELTGGRGKSPRTMSERLNMLAKSAVCIALMSKRP